MIKSPKLGLLSYNFPSYAGPQFGKLPRLQAILQSDWLEVQDRAVKKVSQSRLATIECANASQTCSYELVFAVLWKDYRGMILVATL